MPRKIDSGIDRRSFRHIVHETNVGMLRAILSKHRFKMFLRKSFFSKSCCQSKNPRTEISCWVDCVSTVKAKGHSYDNHNQAYTDSRDAFGRLHVSGVGDGENANEKKGCRKNLKKMFIGHETIHRYIHTV